MRKALAVVGLAVLVWTVQDILVWGLFIERRHLDHDPALGAVYQQLHQLCLLALIVAGIAWLRARSWLAAWVAGATWTLAYSGLADLLYYWLALRPLPGGFWHARGVFPWLDGSGHIFVLFHPATGDSLAASSAVWATVWVALLLGGAQALVLRRRLLSMRPQCINGSNELAG